MNVAGNSEIQFKNVNVLPLFSDMAVQADPLQDLIMEGQIDSALESSVSFRPENRLVVQANQFPDQSMYILDKQISTLKGSLDRLKFYLSDLDDLLPR